MTGLHIITREEWGADPTWLTWLPLKAIVIHHTVTPNEYAQADGAAWMRAVYRYHALERGWGDIGYHYLVDRYGNAYAGRFGGAAVEAAHTSGHNTGTIGIAVAGTHTNQPATSETLEALIELCADLCIEWRIEPERITGHRDYLSTICPGDALYAVLPALRRAVMERIEEEEGP